MRSSFSGSENRRWLLAGGLAAVAGWTFYSGWIAPLRERAQTTRLRMAELSGSVDRADKAIEEVRALEQQVAAVRTELDSWRRERPAESAMVWLPERIKLHFRHFGIAEAVTRLNTTKEEPELPRFQRAYWAVDLPMQEKAGELGGLLVAIAELEQSDPHLRVIDLSIRQEGEEPRRRTAVINISTLARE